MKLLLKSLALFAGLAFATPALAFSYSCADWKDPDHFEDFWKEATAATIADCVQDMGFVMGFSVKDRDDEGNTPLHFAAAFSKPYVIISLTEAGANVNARNETGNTPLHYAAASSYPDVTIALTEAGADVNARDSRGLTPLHFAALVNSNPDIITGLLLAGADADASDLDNVTPLHHAAWRNLNPDVITALLEAGADGSSKNSDGKTPFDLAKENEFIKNTDAYWALNDARFK